MKKDTLPQIDMGSW